MRLVAVTDAPDAPDFALRPRVEGSDQIVVPLPPERQHLVSVEVGLLVIRRDTGEIMDQQEQIFSWKTRGAALRFYLPALPGGDYVAEIRATSTVLVASGGAFKEVRLPDKSQVSFRSAGDFHPLRSREFKYHFEVHHAAGDTPVLAQDDREMLAPGIMQLQTILRNNAVKKVTLDCWASSDGDTNYNMRVSLKRCAWVHAKVLRDVLGAGARVELIEASHGEDNPPEREPTGITGEALQKIQKLNRVVILKIYTLD